MKQFIFILSLLIVNSIFADWAEMGPESLAEESELIVVVVFTKVLKSDVQPFIKTQLVELKVRQLIKGKAGTTVKVHGMESGICAPQYYFKGIVGDLYLLHLRKSKDGTYNVVNIGAEQITDKGLKVNRLSSKKQKWLDARISMIQAVLKKGEKK